RAVVADTAATAATALRTAVPHPQRVPGRRPVAFVVTDVVPGAEGAGGELRATEPAYREALDHCAAAVTAPAGANPRPGPDGRGEASGSLHHTAFATRYALARLWMSWGITPAAVLGDGVGEYVAACLAGALTVEDALALAATSPADGNGRTCGTPPAAPQIPCLANATHTWLSGPDATDPAHWTGGPRHPLHRERAQPLLEQLGDPLILEIGAETDPRHVLTALADLWSRGAEPDWKAFAATDPGRRTPLPSYPFERRSYRIATRRQSRTPENPEHGEAPSVPGDAPAPSHERPELATEYLAPRDRLEHTVTEVWERLLGFRRIGVHDDFYALGGDSLLSTRIVADLRDAFGADLPMERIIEALTPAGQAEVVRALLVERLDAMTDEEAARLLGGAGPHGTAPAGGDVTPGAH
ncbi:phosphopantetheine-binding protein, partial [Streptomyces sp. JJ36]|uniref:phosphopantetheine-binding protein n=1 Tax=Streptomyces sp. JJ36 TaxID=2736645 RepID=UPI001F1DCC27